MGSGLLDGGEVGGSPIATRTSGVARRGGGRVRAPATPQQRMPSWRKSSRQFTPGRAPRSTTAVWDYGSPLVHSDAKRSARERTASALGRSVSDVDRSYPTLGGRLP